MGVTPGVDDYMLTIISDIMNRKSRLAWELYLKMETSGESFSLLQLIANDCYKVRYKHVSRQLYNSGIAFCIHKELVPFLILYRKPISRALKY